MTQASADGKARSARPLRRGLALVLTVVALTATVLLGGVVFIDARALLTAGVEGGLVNQQRSQARVLANGLDFVADSVFVISRDRATVEALQQFADAFEAVGEMPLDDGRSAALDDFYASGGVEASGTGDAPRPPQGAAARFLQYHYLAANPYAAGERSALVEAAGDESSYGVVHAANHPSLDARRRTLGFSDLLLFDRNGNIVYTAEKRSDFGRNLTESEYLGQAVSVGVPQRLAASALGEPVIVDFERYPPAGGTPTLFAAASVYGAEGVLGGVVLEIPIDTLNRLTTSDRRWEEVGLGETGEIFVVGRDLLMRSDSRLWLEDPARYLDLVRRRGYPDEVAASIEALGTTALVQPVDTEPVDVALDGERFVGGARDYLGRQMLTVSGKVENDQVDWVVVAQLADGEARGPLASYLLRLGIVAAIVVPLVALAGLLLAGLFTRPFRPVIEGAGRIADGDLDVVVPDLGRNELGDVGRRLNALAAHLRAQEEALAAEEQETTRLLLSALPARIVEDLRSGVRTVGDLADSATVVAVAVDGVVDAPSIDADTAAEMASRVSRDLEAVAERLGMERVRSAADQHLFLAGLGRPSAEADRAAEFALSVGPILDRFADDTGLGVGYRIGIGSGTVIAGLLSADRLTYSVFGEPPQTALVLVSVGAPSQILVDPAAAHELGDRWVVDPAVGLVDLRGEPISAFSLLGDRQAGDDSDEPEAAGEPQPGG